MAETFKIDIEINAKDNTGSTLSSAQSKLSGFEKSVQKTNEQLSKLSGSNPNININAQDKASHVIDNILNKLRSVGSKISNIPISAIDKASTVISKVSSSLKSIAGKTWQVTVTLLDKVTAPLRGIFNMIKSPIMQVGAALGVGSLVGSTVSSGMSFDAGMSKVQAVSGASASDMSTLRGAALAEAVTTKFTPTETADALTYMGMAGWKTQEMISGLPAVLDLAAAGGTDLATTSDIVTDAITAFGMKASDATHFADVMASASSNANTNVNLMGETFKYAGSLAGTLGYSIDDVALATGLMANASIKGSQAGTALRTGLVNLAKPTAEMQRVMDKYGLSLTDANGKTKSLREILTDVRKAFKGTANEADEAGELAQLFGKYGLAGWAAIVNASEDDFNQLADAIDNSKGAAEKMANTQLDNLQGDVTLFKSAWTNAQQAVFDGFNPLLRKGVQGLTKTVQTLPDKIRPVVENIVDLFTNPYGLSDNGGTIWEDWKNAGAPTSIGGKIKFAWDEFVSKPFGEWWKSTGRDTISEIMSGAGKIGGTALSGGIKALFGLTDDSIASDGKSIAGQFIDGFKEGFDGKGVIDAIGNAFKEHPIASGLLSNWLIKSFTGVDLAGILLKALGKGGSNLGDKLKELLFGGGSSGEGSRDNTGDWNGGRSSSYSCQNMNVTASVVNVYGNVNQQPGSQSGGQPTPQQSLPPTQSNGGALPQPNGSTPIELPPAGGNGSTPVALPPTGGSGAAPIPIPASSGGSMSGGVPLALPAAGGAAAFGAAKGAAAIGTGSAAESAGALTADAILGADGTIVATGGQLALAEAGLSAGAIVGMTTGMVIPVAAMTWGQSGLNPKNYTVGQNNQAAWKKSGLNPADYGVTNTKSVSPSAFKESQLLVGDAAIPGRKPGGLLDTLATSVIGGITATTPGLGIAALVSGLFSTSASAAEIDEAGAETGKDAMDAFAKGAENSDITKGKGSKDLGTQLGTTLLNAIGEGIKGMDAESLKDLNIGESIMNAMGSNLESMDAEALKGLNIGENLMTAIGGSLESMDTEALKNLDIGESLMNAIGESLSQMDESALKDLNIGENLMNTIGESLTEMDSDALKDLNIGESLINTIGESLAVMDSDALKDLNIGESLMNAIGSSLAEMDTEALGELEIGTALMEAISNSIAEMDTDALGELNIGTSLIEAISASLSEIDTDALANIGIGETLMNAISSSFENIDLEGLDIGSKIMEMISSSLESVDFSEIDIGSKISEGISASMEAIDISSAIEPIISQLEELNAVECNPQINATDNATQIIMAVQELADTYGATTATAILAAQDNASAVIANVSAALNALNGKTATVTINVQQNGSIPSGVGHAVGGIMDHPHMGLVAEAGPEGIIPLSPSKRNRGIDLWEKVGQRLGVMPYEEGGIVGAPQRPTIDLSGFTHTSDTADGGTSEDFGVTDGGIDGGSGRTPINVTIQPSIQPTININGGDADDNKIVGVMRTHFRDMANDVSRQIAGDLDHIFRNIPVKGVTY